MLMAEAKLSITDEFERGYDYAITLEKWIENFEDNLEQIKAMGFDEEFIRMFRLYLNACMVSFQKKTSRLYQIRFKKVA